MSDLFELIRQIESYYIWKRKNFFFLIDVDISTYIPTNVLHHYI